jgi:Zn-dependent peptidase ImmA (M78 family)
MKGGGRVTVNVSQNILRWVDKFVPTLDTRSKQNLKQWESGEKSPTFNQIENLSKVTHIPLGYFFLTKPPEEHLDLLEFRTIDSVELQHPSRDLIDTVRQMENIQEWMRDYIISSMGEKVSFVGSIDVSSSVADIAQTIKKTLGITIKWYEKCSDFRDSYNFLRQKISTIGVIVMQNGIVGNNTHRKLQIEEFRAFTLVDEYAPLVFINSADFTGAQVFSLLHEFAHIGIGKNSLFNARLDQVNGINKYESLCNAVAAEILVPSEVFEEKWRNTDNETEEKIRELSRYFKCSQSVIARRALDKRFITKDMYESIIAKARENYKRKDKSKSGGDFFKTQASRIDRRFFDALNESLYEGKTPYPEAFRLTNTNSKTFDELVREVRGERKRK